MVEEGNGFIPEEGEVLDEETEEQNGIEVDNTIPQYTGEAIEKIQVRIRGTKPMLMHSPAGLGSDSGRGKTSPADEANGYLYKDENGKISVPALTIKASLRNAGKDHKVGGKGKKTFMQYVRAGVNITPSNVPLITPNSPEQDMKIDTRPAVVNRGRILRSRPRFDKWELEFTIELLDPIVRVQDIEKILRDAGKFVGLLDFRPEFGTFEVLKCEVIKGPA